MTPIATPARRVALALVLFALSGQATRAETLEEAWELALQRDHALAAVRSQAEAAGLDAQAARAQRWPTVAVSGSYARLDDSPAFDFTWTGLPMTSPELFEDDELIVGAASVTIPLYTGGRVASSIAAAEARRRGSGAQVTAAISDLKLAVADAYFNVLRTRKGLEVAQSSVRSLESLAQDTASMFERELVPKNESLAAQVALANARQNELRAANAAEVALAAYNRRLGQPMERSVDLAEALTTPASVPDSLETLTEQALERRPELTMLDAHAEAYGQLARTERSRTLPQFALSGGYHYLENRFLDDETVGVAGIGVQWAMFDGGQARKRAAALERTRKATQQQRAESASVVELQVREYWLGVREARERVRVTAEAAAQAEESLRIARERYGAGLGTHTQTLEAETMRVQALGNRDDARLDERLAELRLLRAAGRL